MKNKITKMKIEKTVSCIRFAVFIVAMVALMAIPAICRYKACGIAATGGEMFLALVIITVYGIRKGGNNEYRD